MIRHILYVIIRGQKIFLSLKASDKTYSVYYYLGQKRFLRLTANDKTYSARYYPGTESISEPYGQ